ncbi:TIGR00341 family protein [Methanothermococcus okinawensis]|uniref:TIGR00341 family protein n=1 Tax=Methanothermococcus okinawensis TaxID=155863 RepID=UPI00064EAAEB|nr:TIGR00341 family protein [Methanothermococcus okinawensis]
MKYIKIIVPKKLLNEVEDILKEHNAYSISIIEPLKTSIKDGVIITCNAKTNDAEKIVIKLRKMGIGEKGYGSINIMPANITFSCRDEGLASSKLSPLELYYKATSMVKLSKDVIIKIVLASVMGVIGLIEHNIPTLIGAMIIAPLVDTVMASAIGNVIREKKLVYKGMKKEIICTLIVIACAFLLGILFDIPKPIITTYLHENTLLLSAIIAIIAGVSGGMSIASGKDYEIIGVTIDVSILIPALLVGLALSTQDIALIYTTFVFLIINIILLDIGGYVGLKYKLWNHR